MGRKENMNGQCNENGLELTKGSLGEGKEIKEGA